MPKYGNNGNNGSCYYVLRTLCYLSYLIITNKTLAYPFCQWSSRRVNISPNSHSKEVMVLVVLILPNSKVCISHPFPLIIEVHFRLIHFLFWKTTCFTMFSRCQLGAKNNYFLIHCHKNKTKNPHKLQLKYMSSNYNSCKTTNLTKNQQKIRTV